MEIWRWIESEAADGATNMATDQALFENTETVNQPAMRVYRWSPYCISLGYHQSEDDIDFDLCRERHIDVVRRPTGGRAVLHAEEVTYAVIVPQCASIFQQSITAVYNLISRGLLIGIQKLGVPASFEKHSVDLRDHYKRGTSVSCFSASARHEIVVDGKKLVGSAQRRLPGKILQHGSILLDSAHLALPELIKKRDDQLRQRMKIELMNRTVSLCQCLGKEISFKKVVENIKKGMEEALSIRFVDGELTIQERESSERLKGRFSILSC
jgi:lipoate-protein ligase A